MKAPILFSLAGAAALVSWNAGQPAAAGGWVSLFDGATLAGWHVEAKPADAARGYWTVRDGLITCDSRGRADHDYVWLVTDAEYGDFELRLKVRSYRESPGNSGVQVRSRYDREAYWLDGPQVDINPPAPYRMGLIYDETRGSKRWLNPPTKDWKIEPSDATHRWIWRHADEGDGWNDMLIACRGTRIRTVVNGLTITDGDFAGILDDELHRKRNVGLKGHIALQLHVKDDLHIQYKDLFVRGLR